MTKRKARK